MTFDILIQNSTVVDGTGKKPAFKADVAITDDRIAAIGDLSDAQADLTIDATGHIVCPGFIDVHVHGEIALLTGQHRYGEVSQGITTLLTAPDGFGWTCLSPEQTRELWAYTRFSIGQVDLPLGWPTIEDYLSLFPDNSPANIYPQVPHCAVRLKVMGWDARVATDDELAQMGRLTRDWMEAGAGVLNLGLDYQPSANADFRELVALCKIAAEYGGIYAAHARYHTLGRKAAWEETIHLSREANIPVHISHERVDEEAAELLDRIDREDIDLTFESYLYKAGMTHMYMMLPMEYQSGSPDEVNKRLQDPTIRSRSLTELQKWLGRGDQIVGYTRSGRFIGQTLTEAAEETGQSIAEFAYDILLKEQEHQVFVFPWQVDPEIAETTVRRTVTHPRMMIASDGVFNIPHPHPRGFGCFARVLGHFVREHQLISLEEAIYKMSGFPARRFDIPDRGELSEGKVADIVLFDPETVAAQSTFENPIQAPVGIPWVLVNGTPVIENGEPTGHLPGSVIRHRK
ncbi:MAG: D-aminoacylase [bacterium]|nr:D-aminoacylase [bacterium]